MESSELYLETRRMMLSLALHRFSIEQRMQSRNDSVRLLLLSALIWLLVCKKTTAVGLSPIVLHEQCITREKAHRVLINWILHEIELTGSVQCAY